MKLTSYSDKNLIIKALKHLKTYNEERKTKSMEATNYVYVTEHLPRELQEQKKLLLPVYKNARKKGKKIFWRFKKETYCLYIDNVKYCDDHFSDSSENTY